MKLNDITGALNTIYRKSAFQIKKHSPELLLGAGIISGIASGVKAYQTKPRIDEIIDSAKEEKEKIANYIEEFGYSEEYTKEDQTKDHAIIITQTSVKVVKEFAPAIGLGIISLSCILASHNVLKKRNAALAMAYEIVDRTFKAYRSNVVERFGEEIDKELRFGVKEIEVEDVTVGKDGREKKKIRKEKVATSPYGDMSEFARCFDSISPYWEKDSVYNLTFLKTQQQYANDLLRANKFLYLNDVYDLLGFPRTRAGQIVGWVYDPDGSIHGKAWPKDKPWDNYVDFGIYEIKREANRDFVNGLEDVIWLDFNVDGEILGLMK